MFANASFSFKYLRNFRSDSSADRRNRRCNRPRNYLQINGIRRPLSADHGCQLPELVNFSSAVCYRPAIKYCCEIDSGSVFYHRWFVLRTDVTRVHTHTRMRGATRADKTPAVAMPETSCVSAVFYPSRSISLAFSRRRLDTLK